jgi:hypothetical protein
LNSIVARHSTLSWPANAGHPVDAARHFDHRLVFRQRHQPVDIPGAQAVRAGTKVILLAHLGLSQFERDAAPIADIVKLIEEWEANES